MRLKSKAGNVANVHFQVSIKYKYPLYLNDNLFNLSDNISGLFKV